MVRVREGGLGAFPPFVYSPRVCAEGGTGSSSLLWVVHLASQCSCGFPLSFLSLQSSLAFNTRPYRD